jgi:hypothetical protein
MSGLSERESNVRKGRGKREKGERRRGGRGKGDNHPQTTPPLSCQSHYLSPLLENLLHMSFR